MFYSEDEFNEVDIFSSKFTKKIKLFAVIRGDGDSFVDLYFESHNKFYDLTLYNNYPGLPFLELEEVDSINDLNFHEEENCEYYKIPKKLQGLKFLNIGPNEISSDLFKLSRTQPYDISDLVNNKKSCLTIDKKFQINKDDYIDIKKELINFNESKSISR